MKLIKLKSNCIFSLLVILLFVFIIGFVSSYTRAYPSYTSSGNYISSGSYSDWNPDFDRCEAGQDFIVQIAPFGCSPAIVTSDLLEEQNVPVFCQLSATKLNPLIDVNVIEDISFKGSYPEEISGVGFHPAQAALSVEDKINFPVMDNIGYVVLVLKKQKSEKNMSDVVRGNLTATLKYDIEDAFGIGKSSFYLPEIQDNSDWEEQKKFYSFWEGRGYLRAEGVDENSATISIHDSTKRLSVLNLEKNSFSKKLSLPGFDCLARFQVKLEALTLPDTRARLKIGSEYIEVIEGENFLDNRCSLSDIQRYGLLKIVKASCREDEERSSFNLIISPKIEFKIGETIKSASIGEKVFESGEKNYFLAYVGSLKKTNSQRILDTDETKDLIVYLYETNTKINKLSEDEISNFANKINFHLKKYSSGEEKSITPEEKIKVVKYGSVSSISDKEVQLVGYSNANDEDFNNFIETKEVEASEVKELGDLSNNANDDFNKIIESFSSEKKNEVSEITYGKKAFTKAINFANELGQKNRVMKLCKKLKEQYPEDEQADSYLCKDNYRTSNSESATNSVFINGESEFITLYDVLEPGLSEYGLELIVNYPKSYDKDYEIKKLGKNQLVYLNAEKTEYIQLTGLEEDSATIEIKLKPSGEDKKDIADITKKVELKKGEQKNFGSDYVFSIKEIKLKKYARVSLIPYIENVETEVNFSFQIGIEKRNIKLSPEKTKEKIEDLDKFINDWTEKSEDLGKVIKGLKGACLGMGGLMIFKNIFDNLDGKSIARQKIMRDKGGWYDKCSEALTTKKMNGKTVDYVSMNDCFTENSEKIDKDVENYYKILQTKNQEIKNIEQSSGAAKDNQGILSFLGLGEKVVDTDVFMGDYIPSVKKQLKTDLNNVNCSNDLIITSSEIDTLITYTQWKKNYNYNIQDLKDLDFYSTSLKQNPNDELAKNQVCSIYGSIQEASKEDIERESLLGELNKAGYTNADISHSADANANKGTWNGWTINGEDILDLSSGIGGGGISKPYFETNKEYNIKVEVYGGKKYLFVLDGNNNKYGVIEVFNYKGIDLKNKITLTGKPENSEEIAKKFTYTKINAEGYQNTYKSSGTKPHPLVKYFETEPYKGMPAIVPFDLENGWYTSIKQTLPVVGNIGSYEQSGRVSSFYVCNVGLNNREDNMKDDDTCTMINTGTGQAYGQIPSFENENDAKKLVNSAVKAIEEASRQYKAGITQVTLTMRNGKKENIKVGEPQIDIPDIQCQDFMSPKDCQILFNVCDPVICPSSRCDLGGAYPVQDVIQSGIIGSIALCFPNYREGIYIPVCLTGIKAGIDGLLSVYQSYRDCLQESLDSGQMIGICDEIYSIHLCDFFWRQALPAAKMIIPKMIEIAMGQNTRGGGEYMSVQNAWSNAEKSVNYFTEYYSAESYKAFKSRVLEGVGEEVCKSFVSVSYPDESNLLESLINPDSPPQFHGRFDKTVLTTTTNPPTAHYKVYYYIYAGKESRAYYQVYLKGDTSSSYYKDTSTDRVVGYGYIPEGEYASETVDFTAPSGYQELCIVVNGQEECGFKQVSSSFAINYVEDKYLKEQASEKDIQSETECVSGSVSLYSLATLNIESAADEMVNPAIYDRGIIRICSTENPGKNSDSKYGTEDQRWIDVGYCDDKNIRCWIDKKSVAGVIENIDIENNTLGELTEHSLELLKQEGKHKTYAEVKTLIEQIEKSTPEIVIELVNEDYNKVFWNKDKAELLLQRGKAYAELAQKLYNELKSRATKKIEKIEGGETGVVTKPIIDCDKFCGSDYERGYETDKDSACKSGETKKPSSEKTTFCCCVPKDEGGENSLTIQNGVHSTSKVEINGNEKKYESYVQEAYETFDINPNLVMAIIQKESSGNQDTKGSSGEYGLMQLKGGINGAIADITNENTGRCYGLCYTYYNHDWVTNPKTNVYLGTCYLKCLREIYKITDPKLVLAAYNAGPTLIKSKCIDKDLSFDECKNDLPSTTKSYIEKVISYYENYLDLE